MISRNIESKEVNYNKNDTWLRRTRVRQMNSIELFRNDSIYNNVSMCLTYRIFFCINFCSGRPIRRIRLALCTGLKICCSSRADGNER